MHGGQTSESGQTILVTSLKTNKTDNRRLKNNRKSQRKKDGRMSTCSLDCLIVFEIHALLHLPLWEILFPDRKQVCMDEIHTAVDLSQVYRQ